MLSLLKKREKQEEAKKEAILRDLCKIDATGAMHLYIYRLKFFFGLVFYSIYKTKCFIP